MTEDLNAWRGQVLRDAEANGRIVKLTGHDSLLTPGPGDPLPYLTDEELATLRAHPVRRTYTWTHHGQRYAVEVRFVMASASYIDVHYNGHPIDCINVWDDERRVPLVRTPAQLRAAADAYWTDTDTIRDMIRGGLGLPMGGTA